MREAKLYIDIRVGCAGGTYTYTVYGSYSGPRAHNYGGVSTNAPTKTSVTI